MKHNPGDWLRVLMIGACVAACIIVAVGAGAWAVLEDLRAIAEANPAYVRAQGEADVLSAAADAVRADTRIASWAPVLLWLTVVGGVLLNALLAALAFYVWRAALTTGRGR